ncbi:MAG: hypothetical protein RIC56_22715 [Pseudomonadales bacterium]
MTLDAVAAAFHHWFEHPEFDPDLPVLWDLRGQFIQASVADIGKLHQITSALTDRRRASGGRSAIIAATQTAGRALAGVTTNPNFVASIRVFQSEADALAWLRAQDQPLEDTGSG